MWAKVFRLNNLQGVKLLFYISPNLIEREFITPQKIFLDIIIKLIEIDIVSLTVLVCNCLPFSNCPLADL